MLTIFHNPKCGSSRNTLALIGLIRTVGLHVGASQFDQSPDFGNATWNKVVINEKGLHV
jgi:hypothetical protein